MISFNAVVGAANQVDGAAVPALISRGVRLDRVLLCKGGGFRLS
jgi:hypothetical protein